MPDTDNWSQYAMQCQCEMENLGRQLQEAKQIIRDLTIELNQLKQTLKDVQYEGMGEDT